MNTTLTVLLIQRYLASNSALPCSHRLYKADINRSSFFVRRCYLVLSVWLNNVGSSVKRWVSRDGRTLYAGEYISFSPSIKYPGSFVRLSNKVYVLIGVKSLIWELGTLRTFFLLLLPPRLSGNLQGKLPDGFVLCESEIEMKWKYSCLFQLLFEYIMSSWGSFWRAEFWACMGFLIKTFRCFFKMFSYEILKRKFEMEMQKKIFLMEFFFPPSMPEVTHPWGNDGTGYADCWR